MDAKRLGEATVLDLRGEAVPLASLWEGKPTVVVWLRHYG